MIRNLRLRSLFCFLTLAVLLFTGCFSSMAADTSNPISADPISENDDQITETASKVTPSSKYNNATVNVTALNLRCGPGTEYEIVGVLAKSQPILVLGQSDDWYVIYDYDTGRIGCVNGYYITMVSEDSKDDPKLPGEDSPSIGNSSENKDNTGNNSDSSTAGISDGALRLMTLVNDIRTRHGCTAVRYSSALSKVAQDKAEDMVRNMYFSHQSELYGTPFEMMRAYGISFTCAGENIAGNQTVDGAFYAWMNSQSHKENIMNNNYDRMGIGICVSPIYGKIIVQMFAGG